MRRSVVRRFWKSVGLGLCLTLVLGTSWVWGGPLRLKMTDGTAVEVPYYWEEGGELKFEIPGGIVGVPRVQVASVQEVVVDREFDPEALTEAGEGEGVSSQKKMLQDLISATSSGAAMPEKLPSEESLRLLRTSRGIDESARRKEKVHGARYELHADFSELVKTPGSGLMIEMRKIVTSRDDLRQNGFTLNLYDGEGNVVQRQTCLVNELDVDRKAMKQMGLRGRVFSLMASVQPNDRIKRYEITVDHR
jgi:hypothetical protein